MNMVLIAKKYRKEGRKQKMSRAKTVRCTCGVNISITNNYCPVCGAANPESPKYQLKEARQKLVDKFDVLLLQSGYYPTVVFKDDITNEQRVAVLDNLFKKEHNVQWSFRLEECYIHPEHRHTMKGVINMWYNIKHTLVDSESVRLKFQLASFIIPEDMCKKYAKKVWKTLDDGQKKAWSTDIEVTMRDCTSAIDYAQVKLDKYKEIQKILK